MDNYSTILENVVNNGVTLKEILRLETQRLLNLLLKTELTEYLKYEKYDPSGYNSGNSRNGYYERTLKTLFGEIVLEIPRDSVQKEALHVLLGITTDGRKEVLDYTLAAHENTDTYIELLQSIKRRGVEEVFMFVTDGFCWLNSIFREIFPKARHQYCWVHICRNVRSYVRQIDWTTIKEELKGIYGAEDRKSASKRLVEFLDKWYSKYPKLADKLYDITDFFQYMLLPQPIRKHFYTNNTLEGLNNLLKRYTRKKEMFPDENSMERFVCSIFLDYNNKNFFKTATGFEEASIAIDQLFNDLNCGKLNLKEDDYT